MCKLTTDRLEARDLRRSKITDGKLGFDMPRLAPEAIKQLLGTWHNPPILPGIDTRYATKK